ncbi:MAG: radical SAM family heme chaperone HemW [Pseudomonadota bacterium]
MPGQSHPKSTTEPFGLYIHWPFCQSKCPYCDFNSHVRTNGIDETAFLSAYLKEMQYVAEQTNQTKLNTIFFGGGTPSLMHQSTIQTLIDEAAKLWPFDKNIEITLEANPSSVEAKRFKGYHTAGVNRVSLGIQAFQDEDLKKLGRLHTVQDAETALDIAMQTFDRVSFDLIYARPQQSPRAWKEELQYALTKGADHLSLYQLTIEPGTRFADLYSHGKLTIPNAQRAQEHYEITQQLCEQAGFIAYEISNHAKNGQVCQHNMIYWRYNSYAGIGPGAHGRLAINHKRYATSTWLSPEKWREAVQTNGHGISEYEVLLPQQQAYEMVLMGLRLNEGISLKRLKTITGFEIDMGKIENLTAKHLINVTPDHLTVTPNGRFVLNHIIETITDCLIMKMEIHERC